MSNSVNSQHYTTEQILLFADGLLNNEEAESIRRHCAECSQCAAELQLQRMITNGFATEETVSEHFHSTVMARLKLSVQPPPQEKRRRMFIFPWRGYAFPVVLAVALVMVPFFWTVQNADFFPLSFSSDEEGVSQSLRFSSNILYSFLQGASGRIITMVLIGIAFLMAIERVLYQNIIGKSRR